jgi:chemotaxis response regulator CheB
LSEQAKVVSTLVVAPPGAIEEVIRAVLGSIPEIAITGYVTGCLAAVEAMQGSASDLVVISGQAPVEEIIALSRQAAAVRRAPRIVVVAASQAQATRLAAAGGLAVVTPWDSVRELRKALAGEPVRRRGSGETLASDNLQAV